MARGRYKKGTNRFFKKNRKRSYVATLPRSVGRRMTGGANILLRGERKYQDGSHYGPRSLQCAADPTNVTDAYANVPVDGVIMPGDGAGNYDEGALADIAQGSGATQRDGRQVGITAIRIRGHIMFGPDATASGGNVVQRPNYVRVLLVQDMQCNGTAASVSDVLATGSLDAAAQTAGAKRFRTPGPIDAFQNLNNQHRFRVLSDKTYHHAPTNPGDAGAGNQQYIMPFKMKHLFRNPVVVNYIGDGASVAISQIADNNFFVIALSGLIAYNDAATWALSPAYISFTSRVRFIDH